MFPDQPLNPVTASILSNMIRAAKLKQDMQGITSNGLPNYAGTASQPRLDAGYAPGPYQFNMPAPGPASNPEDKARSKVARGKRRASRTGAFEQRLVDAGPVQQPAAMQRGGNPNLTPTEFLKGYQPKRDSAQQAMDIAAHSEAAGNPGAANEFLAANQRMAAVSPTQAQANTAKRRAQQQGTLPTQTQVAANTTARQEELASRKKAVSDRGKIRGKANELGISRVQAAALNGSLGNGANAGGFGDLFNHYLGMTGNPQMAAALADTHHKAQNSDPIRDQLMALAGQAADPATAKRALDAAMARMPGGQGGVANVMPGDDPAKTDQAVKDAARLYPNNPRKQIDHVVANAPGVDKAQAEEVIKKTTPAGKVFEGASADALKRKLALQQSDRFFGPAATGSHADTLGPLMESLLPLLIGSEGAGALDAGIMPHPGALPPAPPPAQAPNYSPFPMFPGA